MAPKSHFPKLKRVESKIFLDVGYSISIGGLPIEKIVVAGIRNEEKREYMERFVDLKLCELVDGKYRLTAIGKGKFDEIRKSAERSNITTGFGYARYTSLL